MSRDDFEALVKRLEPFAQAHPRSYRARVAGLAALGYVYLAVVAGCLLVATAGLVWLGFAAPNAGVLKLVFGGCVVTLSLLAMIGKSLWVRFEPPAGRELRRAEHPALFAMIDELRRRLRSQPFHRVVLTDDFNAAVSQFPRLGILGWHRNYLILGLPLMEALTPEQFRAVLAHEFGHLSANHSRFSGWIYRVRRTWGSICAHLAQQDERQARWHLFSRFVRWYGPYFNGYSFVLARTNEYEADRCAAELTSAEVTAGALVTVQLRGRQLEEGFWSGVYDRVAREPAPPAWVYGELATTVRSEPDPARAQTWLRQAFLAQTTTSDTHPCLADRLAALGFSQGSESANRPPPVTAAEEYLGASLQRWRAELSADWAGSRREAWKKRHEELRQLEQRLAEVEARLLTQPPDAATLWERAQLAGQVRGDAAAEEALHQVRALEPGHLGATYALGRLLLQRDDPSGVALIEQVMAADPEAVRPGSDLLYAFYRRVGRHEDVRALLRRYDQHEESSAKAEAERAQFTKADVFLPHEVAESVLERMRADLRRNSRAGRAWLVRKQVRHFPERPVYLLVVEPRSRWYQLRLDRHDVQLQQWLAREVVCPGDTRILLVVRGNGWVRKKVRGVPGAEIYSLC